MLLASCSAFKEEIVDGDVNVPPAMDQAISNFLVKNYDDTIDKNQKVFEVHKVYGTSEYEDVTTVYFWSYVGKFSKETGTEELSGHSLPAVIEVRKVGSNYSIVKYKEPQDGSLYKKSIEKMFPKKFRKMIEEDSGNVEHLVQKMNKDVQKWLNEE